MKTKYIVVDFRGMEVPIFFGEIAKHSQIAQPFGNEKVLSAGNVQFFVGEDGNVKSCVYDRSETLQKESVKADEKHFDKLVWKFKIKFIVVDHVGYFRNSECMICFPEFINHEDVAYKFGIQNVVSAGFLKLWVNNGQADCHVSGKSISLKMEPREQDELLGKNQITSLY